MAVALIEPPQPVRYRTRNQRPTFARRPVRVVGTPVAFAIRRLAFVTPSARRHENVTPGPSFTSAL